MIQKVILKANIQFKKTIRSRFEQIKKLNYVFDILIDDYPEPFEPKYELLHHEEDVLLDYQVRILNRCGPNLAFGFFT